MKGINNQTELRLTAQHNIEWVSQRFIYVRFQKAFVASKNDCNPKLVVRYLGSIPNTIVPDKISSSIISTFLLSACRDSGLHFILPF